MKKALLSLLAIAGVSLGANAQLARGTVAPDFTLTDINGTSHHLYSYLDSGYTVILDISAAWCSPCWAAHQSHVLEDLTTHYGPNGTITPKKIKVIYIEGESTNTTAQLNGTGTSGGGSNRATDTQGDWVTGTNYPIIDNNSLNTPYALTGFPTFTIICRDRLVSYATAGYGSTMGSESWWLQYTNTCPNYAPSATVDAKAVTYTGADYFLCTATPTLKFQNYSMATPITSATVKVMSGSTVVATQAWTGNLAPFAVGTVNMPSFSQAGPYTFEVTTSGDSYAANNTDNLNFSMITAASASAVPFTENFESSSAMPAKFKVDAEGGFFFYDGTVGPPNQVYIKGANGQNTKTVVVDYWNMDNGTTSELLLTNYNNQSATNSSFEFDVAHAQYAATGGGSTDKLEVLVSTNCGQNWTSVWSKQGATLSTHAPVGGTTQFIPAAAADWRHEGVSLNNYKSNNLFIKFKATSSFGNLGFIDNIKVTNTTSIDDVIDNNSFNVYPNPATEVAHISFNVTKSTDVTVIVTDMMGRVVKTISNENLTAGSHKIDVSTTAFPAGIYNVKIQTEAGSKTQRLTVIK